VPSWYEYDANVLVILAIAALAILACVVLVSLGKGGELTEFPPDVPPLNLPEAGRLTAVDFMALRLPVNLVGYHTESVDETLRRAANAISARDTRIAVLEQRVSELLSSRLHARQEVYAAPGGGPRTDHEPEAPVMPGDLSEEGDPLPEPTGHVPQAVDGSPDHEPVTWGESETIGTAGDDRTDDRAADRGGDRSGDRSGALNGDLNGDRAADRADDASAGKDDASAGNDDASAGKPVEASVAKDGDERA
jgi:hypothetical protein